MNNLIIFIIIIAIARSNKFFKFPFKTIYSQKLTHDNYISELIDNKIYIELKIGTPFQKIQALLKLNQIPFFITSSLFNNSIGFDSTKSSSYTQDGNKTYTSNLYDYNLAFLGEDKISIEDTSKNDFIIDRINFFLAINLTENNKNISGEIGLKIINPPYMSFINQLKRKDMIKDYIFSLKYTSENEGEFHLGDYFHNYDNNYNESEFNTMEVGLPQKYIDNWELFFFKVILGTGNVTFTNTALLSFEFGLIYGTSFYYNLIKEIFFDNYGKTCEIKKLRNNDFYYVCDRDINLNKFPDLIFNKYDFNFTLNKNDLWKQFDGKYYFLIIFSEEERTEWVLGKIFFKKYTIAFNSNSKIIGFYPNSKNKREKEQKKFNISISWILVIILFILLIIVVIYSIYYIKFKIRKKRVNELEDNYDYTAQKDNNNPISINNE